MSSWVATLPVTDAETLFAKLVETIDACFVEPGHYVIIEAPDNRFVQALVDPEGVLVIETVAAQFLSDTPRPLTLADEDALLTVHHAYDEVLNISLHPANTTTRVSACETACSTASSAQNCSGLCSPARGAVAVPRRPSPGCASPDSDQVMHTRVANIPNATKIAPSRRHV